MTDVFTRKEDGKQPLQDRIIFLQVILLEKAKEEDYHPLVEISKFKRKGDQWFYQRWQIIERKEEQEQIIR